LKITETLGIFQKHFYKMAIFKLSSLYTAKKEKDNQKFQKYFPKYSLKRIFLKFKLMKIYGYTV